MTKNIDGALALVYAQWAAKKIAEGEMADQAESLEAVNDAQQNLRKFRQKLNRAINGSDKNLSLGEMIELKREAGDLGIGKEVGDAIDALWASTEAGQMKRADGTPTYPSPEAYRDATYATDTDKNFRYDAQGNAIRQGQFDLNKASHIAIDEHGDSAHFQQGASQIKRIRDALTDQLDMLKNEASGKELDLQMASQEYSRSTQLASNLLNTRNDALKTIVQALSRA